MTLMANQGEDRLIRYQNLLWYGGDGGGDNVPHLYPFVFGVDGMGEIHPETTNPPEVYVSPQPFPVGTITEQPPSSDTGQVGPSSAPGVVSYALPTPNTPLPQPTGSLSPVISRPIALGSISTTVSATPAVSASVVVVSASLPVAATTPVRSPVAIVTILATSTPIPSSSSSASASSFLSTLSSSSMAVITSLAILPSPSADTSSEQPHRQRHTLALYIALAFCILVLFGITCASLSWIMRRRRRRREEAEGRIWIGQVLNDEPNDQLDMQGGEQMHELEKASRENAGPGVAGIGTGRGRRTYPTTPPWHSRNAPIPDNGSFAVPPQGHGITPTSNGHAFIHTHPPWRHPSLLQRAAPTAIDDTYYGLDGGGLTFRQDANGGLTFQPSGTRMYPNTGARMGRPVVDINTAPEDIATPNPYPPTDEASSYPNPYANTHVDPLGQLQPRRPAPALTTMPTGVSYYSYKRAGPFEVTNLMPGDISSRTSETSQGMLAEGGSVPPGLGTGNGNRRHARSLGLPIGRLDDPNPWRRYEGVESRGGAMEANPSEESKGWGATIRSGIYSAVGRIIGTTGEGGEEGVQGGGQGSEKEKDRFTEFVKQGRSHKDRRAGSVGTPSECDINLKGNSNNPDDDTDGSMVPITALVDSRSNSVSEHKPRDERSVNWREALNERPTPQIMIPDSRGWVIEEETLDGSRGRIHIVSGARDRILHRLGSTATNASAATWMSSPTTVYSTDADPVFSSAPTRANTIATSRRDTISSRWSGCRGRNEGGIKEIRPRESALSTTSSDWGTSSMAKPLGMSLDHPTNYVERMPGPA